MRTIITMVLLSTILSMNAQTFVKVNGKGTDVAISPKDGSVYVVGTSKNVFKYDTRSKRFKPHAAQTKNIKRIAISRNNQVFAVSTQDKVLRSVGNSSWSWLNAFGTDVASDNTGYVWAPHKDKGGDIQRYITSWKRPLSRVIIDVAKVAPINDRVAWVVMNDKSIQKYENATWKSMPGAALDIAVDFATTDAYVIGTSRRIFKWNKTRKKWLPLSGTRTDFVSLDVHRGAIWATSTDKSIYRYDPNGIPSNESTGNQDETYRITITKIYGSNSKRLYGTTGVYMEDKNNKQIPSTDTKNRVLDISKKSPKTFPTVYGDVEENSILHGGRIERRSLRKISYSKKLTVNKSKTFKAPKGKIFYFDIQSNLKYQSQNNTPYTGRYQRLKLKISDVELGKEYMIANVAQWGVCFKVEKL